MDNRTQEEMEKRVNKRNHTISHYKFNCIIDNHYCCYASNKAAKGLRKERKIAANLLFCRNYVITNVNNIMSSM